MPVSKNYRNFDPMFKMPVSLPISQSIEIKINQNLMFNIYCIDNMMIMVNIFIVFGKIMNFFFVRNRILFINKMFLLIKKMFLLMNKKYLLMTKMFLLMNNKGIISKKSLIERRKLIKLCAREGLLPANPGLKLTFIKRDRTDIGNTLTYKFLQL